MRNRLFDPPTAQLGTGFLEAYRGIFAFRPLATRQHGKKPENSDWLSLCPITIIRPLWARDGHGAETRGAGGPEVTTAATTQWSRAADANAAGHVSPMVKNGTFSKTVGTVWARNGHGLGRTQKANLTVGFRHDLSR